MSLTSYRAAPPRVTIFLLRVYCSMFAGFYVAYKREQGPLGPVWAVRPFVIVMGFLSSVCAPASMPGDVLLFRGLSHSTIGAVRFHGRVRDGIGWVTDAMVTKQ